MIERCKGKTEADAIRKCLFEVSPLENYTEDQFANDGDSCIPVINKYPGEIFYSKEKSGAWDDIPLGYKKARLIPPEDPFLLTEMPHMVFNSEWFPDITVTHDGKIVPELAISDLHQIVHAYVKDDEIVLAASLWYPYGYKDGTIYTESSKIDFPIKVHRSRQFDSCIGNYGLLVSEDAMDESRDTTIGTGGLSLFNRLCGNFSSTMELEDVAWPKQISELPSREWVSASQAFMDNSSYERYPDPDTIPDELLDDCRLVFRDELPYKYSEYFGDPDTEGITTEIEIYTLRKSPAYYSELRSFMESSTFPLVEEYSKIKAYYQQLKSEADKEDSEVQSAVADGH